MENAFSNKYVQDLVKFFVGNKTHKTNFFSNEIHRKIIGIDINNGDVYYKSKQETAKIISIIISDILNKNIPLNDKVLSETLLAKSNETNKIYDIEEMDNLLCEVFFPRLFKNPKNVEEVNFNSSFALCRNNWYDKHNNINIYNYAKIITDCFLYCKKENVNELSSEEKLSRACSLLQEITEDKKVEIINAYQQTINKREAKREYWKILVEYTKLAKDYMLSYDESTDK